MDASNGSARVRALVAQMTLEEKTAQLGGFWVDQGDELVAPMAGELASSTRYEDASRFGIGHLTRVYGTRPVDPVERAAWLWGEQRRLRTQTRLGIPAIVHEECLTGLAAWKAATFPTPLAWGASFDPETVEEMARLIGESMRTLGVHQGLAPVLDVIRDPRWGRVDECIAEDPYVVGTIGTAYVRGLQDAGVDATLKHFVGYSASRSGRNHAPVSAGPREVADVLLPPFEMAVRDGGARSVMNSYAEIDGMPVAASTAYLTELLRDTWGFDGVVVADYFSVLFLHTMHAIAEDAGDAARLALTAGIDVELPSTEAYGAPLRERVESGEVDEALIDRAVIRVLAQKERLGLLDDTFEQPPTSVDLDSPAHRALARRLAEESVILLSNDGTLPLDRPRRIAVIGPNAAHAEPLMGCYSFANHVLAHHPEVEMGFDIPSVFDALGAQFSDAQVLFAPGCSVEDLDRSGIPEAVEAAAEADVAIVVVGDRAGLFGRGTVGEGNDVESLELPGRAARAGRGGRGDRHTGRDGPADRPAVCDRLGTGCRDRARVRCCRPSSPAKRALRRSRRSSRARSPRADACRSRSPAPPDRSRSRICIRSWAARTRSRARAAHRSVPSASGCRTRRSRTATSVSEATPATDDAFAVSVRVRNEGSRAGTDVVQLYARDVYASVTRPVAQLLGYARVSLEAGQEAVVEFDVPTARLAFTSSAGERIVEPGAIRLWVGASCADHETTGEVELTGPVHVVTADDRRLTGVSVRTVVPAS